MMKQNAVKRTWRLAWIAGPLLALAAIVTAAVWFYSASQPQRFESPPITETLSDEAHEGCLDLGISAEEIEADQDACLTSYWTQDRLYRSDRTLVDWYADNDMVKPCQSRWDGSMICEGVGGYPGGYPKSDNPWWDEQATRDPGRTSVPEGQKMPDIPGDWP